MSLYGALYSGVSGLKSQSSALGIISDNVSNVNTVGYKAGEGTFSTLVTTSSGGAYSPGGVTGANRQRVTQQGLLQATNNPTDLGISGAGFFVVSQTDDGASQMLYTRAGSFTQDSAGNFRNAAGFFLYAWPLDRDGRLPGAQGNTTNTNSSANLSSLKVVNISNLTGAASSTTSVSLAANLKASEAIYPGTGITGGMDENDAPNSANKAKDIIIPQNAGSSTDDLTRGDVMTITTGTGSTLDFVYGGFTVGRSVTSTSDNGDYGSAVKGSGAGTSTIAIGSMSVPDSSNVVTINFPAAHGLADDDVISLNYGTTLGSIPATDLQGNFLVTVVDTDTVTIVVDTTNGAGGANPDLSTATAAVDIRPYDSGGKILDATSATQSFLGVTGTTNIATAALSFTITTVTTGTVTYTYKASAPNIQAGEFNNLNNLAQAISATDGLTARVSNGKIYISAINAEEDIVFENGLDTGTAGSTAGTALYGIDWIRELGLESTGTVSGAANQFSTLQGLADRVNAAAEISATIKNPLADSTITINIDDPLGTITLDDDSGNTGSVLSALGFTDPLNGTISLQTTGELGPAYDPADGDKNMAGGNITPQFSRPVRVYDALGTGHDLNIAFIKTATNSWAVEVYAIDETEVTTTFGNGLLAYGTMFFNGDGSLLSVDPLLLNPIDIAWTNGAEASAVEMFWGTAGAVGVGGTDGVTQYDAKYNVSKAAQNGAPVGELAGISVDEDGFVTVSYSNGSTDTRFKVPLANFASANRLGAVSGNVYAQTTESGEVSLLEAGTSGVGKLVSSALEASNAELAEQLTNMIVVQRAYQANTKLITTSSSLLEELNQAIR